jgi:hypothetical protein
MKLKKILKIIAGVIIFFTLPTLLFFGYAHYKYNEELPIGISGEQADSLAHKMLKALDHNAYLETNYLEWTFRNKNHYKWFKDRNSCEVFWKEFKVVLDFENSNNSKAYVNESEVLDQTAKDLIKKATDYFNNDSFWLVAPYKVFDDGVTRQIVKQGPNDYALLVTYSSGGTTPGDSYLWLLEPSGKPKAYKMWTSILPIDGLEASWSDWIVTESGAQLPAGHNLLFMGISMGDVKGTK